MDPLSLAGFMGDANKIAGGAGGAAGPSTSTSGAGGVRSVFDNSGWTVATGGASAATGGTLPWPILIMGAVVVAAIWKLA